MPVVIIFRPAPQEEQNRRILAAMAAIEECARYLRERRGGDGAAPVKDKIVKEQLFTQDTI